VSQTNTLDEILQPFLNELDPTHTLHNEPVIVSAAMTLAGLHVPAEPAVAPTVQEIATAVNEELCAPTLYKCKTSLLGTHMEFVDPEEVNSFIGYRVRRYDYEASKKKPAYHSVGSDIIFGDCDRRVTWHTGSCDDDVNQSHKIRRAIAVLTQLADILDANEVQK
jgi:hypothetical protein